MLARLTGVGDPLLWGTLAFLLNDVPIPGTALGVLIFSPVNTFRIGKAVGVPLEMARPDWIGTALPQVITRCVEGCWIIEASVNLRLKQLGREKQQ